MLSWLRRNGSTVLILAAVWLFFECWVSWTAFCNRPQYEGSGALYEEYGCQFKGPVLSAVWSSFAWLRHTFDDAESYIALFTAVLAFSTITLWLATRDTLRHARLTAERELRAYVGTTKIYFLKFSPTAPISVHVEVQNFGRTPAHNYQTSIYLAIGAADGSTSFTQGRGFKEEGGESLMPGNLSVVICELSLGSAAQAAAMIDAIKNGGLALYVVGRIEYRDIFGKKRFTNVKRIASGQRSLSQSPFINPDTGNEST